MRMAARDIRGAGSKVSASGSKHPMARHQTPKAFGLRFPDLGISHLTIFFSEESLGAATGIFTPLESRI